MKILHVTKKYPNALGGDAVAVSNLEKQQLHSGNQVAIITSNCLEIVDRPNIYKFGLKDTPSSLDNITIKRLLSLVHLFFISFSVIKKERPDVIHTQSIDMAAAISLAARIYKIPIVHTFQIVTFYDKNQSLLRRKSEIFLARLANATIVTAPNEYDVMQLVNQKLPAVFLPNGVNIKDWETKTTYKNNETFTFITFGRLEEQKGYKYLLQAAAKVEAQFKIIIIGDGSQGNSLRNQSNFLKLTNKVTFMGIKNHEEIKAIMSKADVAVFPSLFETTPMTLLEAWAAKKPVIITPVGIFNEAKKASTGTALLVRKKDPNSLANAMTRLIDEKKLRISLASNGYKEVHKYTWDKISDQLNCIYGEAQK